MLFLGDAKTERERSCHEFANRWSNLYCLDGRFVGGCRLAPEILWELKGWRRANQVEPFALFLLSPYPRAPT